MDNHIKNLATATEVGCRMTFLELIARYSVVIPVIQRDYAQGRVTEKITELRGNFVKDLLGYIEDGERKSHDLDAVYGSVQQDQFIPLDGQQRLTTLFLLHMYLAGMNGDIGFKDTITQKFTYKTRHSSTLFCENLIECDVINIYKTINENIHESNKNIINDKEKGKYKVLSDVIRNQGWYFSVWDQDPTVAGMLVMLDAIDREFRENDGSINQERTKKAYQRLFQDTTPYPPITFLMLPLKGYTRTDDLYIKMNSRGVHLTDFENFKAKLEDHSQKLELSEYKTEGLKHKFDVTWTNKLWKHSESSSKKLDIIMERIIRYIVACSFRGNQHKEARLKDIMEYLLEQNKKTMRFTFSRYCELDVFHKRGEEIKENEKDIIENMEGFFDILCSDTYSPFNCDNIDFAYKKTIAEAATELFIEGIQSNYSKRLLLYSYFKYVHSHHDNLDTEDLSQWMRLVRNLDAATRINDAYEFYRACGAIDKLCSSIATNNVLHWLSCSINFSIEFFRKYQFQEECIKARLLLWNNGKSAIKELIYYCENNYYMEGQIGFLLYISGIWNDNVIDIASLSKDEFDSYYNTLKGYALKSTKIFECFQENSPINLEEECLLERALLTKGCYLKNASAGRRNFCNNPFDRDYSWKAMLVYDPNEQRQHLKNIDSINIFKQVLDDLDADNLVDSLNDIIKQSQNNQPYISLLINNPKLIQYCDQGFITMYDDNQVYLLGQSQLNHYHVELWTYDLYLNIQTSNAPYKGRIEYRYVKRSDDWCELYFKFRDNDILYSFNLRHWKGKWTSAIYYDDPLTSGDIPQSLEDRRQSLMQQHLASDGDTILKDAINLFP